MADYMDRYGRFLKTIIKIFNIPEDERFGRRIIQKEAIREIILHDGEVTNILDIAAGTGNDLRNIQNTSMGRKADYHAFEAYLPNVTILRKFGIHTYAVNIEKDKMPFSDESIDVIIANQIMEHCKELFWIFSELKRIMKPGGCLLIGVPNMASIHCRLLLLLGKQPTCMHTLGGHIRGFTYEDFKYFIEMGGYFKVEKCTGSGFYSIIPGLTHLLSDVFPLLSVSIFLRVRRTSKKEGSFLDILREQHYETNYYTGDEHTNGFEC